MRIVFLRTFPRAIQAVPSYLASFNKVLLHEDYIGIIGWISMLCDIKPRTEFRLTKILPFECTEMLNSLWFYMPPTPSPPPPPLLPRHYKYVIIILIFKE